MKFTEKLLSKNLFEKSVNIGNYWENTAVNYLKKHGYKIIERNYRTKLGEIDIIARCGEYTCFIEVRYRKSSAHGSPVDTVDIYKQRKIVKTAKFYALKHKIYDTPMRFDVVSVTGEDGNKIEVIQNAFECESF